MGAYTFEATPPFRMTRISPHPILFTESYKSPHRHTANRMVQCIFPSGFVAQNQNGKDVFHVSCGENDSHIKILTFDKEGLLKTLKPVETFTVDSSQLSR